MEDTKKKQKIGLVVEGGGMKCAYSAAILDRFLDDGISFGYVNGVSAGAANAASYLGGQRGRNLRFYTEHIKEKDYFGLTAYRKTGDLFNLDYIYSTLTNSDGGDPLDWPAVASNPAQYEVVATDALAGKPHYFDKSEMKQDDYQIIKASCSLPAACRPRFVDGIPYYDGGVSDSIPADRALSQGCDKVVILLSKPRDYVKKPESFRLFYTWKCRKYPKVVKLLDDRHLIYTKAFHHAFELEESGKAFLFAPSAHLPMSTFAMDAEANFRLYELGIQDYAARREALMKFMKA